MFECWHWVAWRSDWSLRDIAKEVTAYLRLAVHFGGLKRSCSALEGGLIDFLRPPQFKFSREGWRLMNHKGARPKIPFLYIL